MYLLLLLIVPLVSGGRTVETNNGPVRGISLKDKKVEAFLGIPFAEPPVGSLRFAKPVPKSPWKETYNATELPPSCIQFRLETFGILSGSNVEREQKEDCLYLNLWVPKRGSNLKPIMVWIHGGSFMFGSSNWRIYDGAALSQRGDVIVATINYRLGTLGFLSSFTDDAPGNMGMYDQLMAIQWIKDNAKHFNGDPDNIVLFGESSGSFAVTLHMVSPLSRNLFKRGILQSGSAIDVAFSETNDLLLMGSHMSANFSGCAEDNEALKNNPAGVIDCMKKVPAEKFSETDLILSLSGGRLLPRVGDGFLPATPVDLFRKGEFKDTEALLGINRNEGTLFLATLKSDVLGMIGEKNDISVLNLDEKLAEEILRPFMLADSLNRSIQSYFERAKEDASYTYIDVVVDVLSDLIINCGAVFQSDFNSLKNQPTYFYVFDYRSPSSPFAKWMGVTHFDEVQYVFGNPMTKPFTDCEREVSNHVMDMWISFSKTGDPNISNESNWPRYTYKDPKYLIIGQKDRVDVRPDDYRCENWREVFRSVIDHEVIRNLKTY